MKKYFAIGILIIIVLSIFVIFKFIFPIDIYVVKGVYMEPTFKEGKVFVNEQALQESYVQGSTYPGQTVVLDNDQYYVMGDNRMHSVDSRLFGPISYSIIIGKIKPIHR